MRDTLGNFEHQVLQVLQQEPNDAYGVTIIERIAARTGKEPSAGALYTTLDRMEKKGFVESWWGEATAERGGRRKRYYKITAQGVFALNRTMAQVKAFAPSLVPQGA
jgi:DNA-binding PadR family transcriptional regulator